MTVEWPNFLSRPSFLKITMILKYGNVAFIPLQVFESTLV